MTKRTNNDLQNTTQKTKIEPHEHKHPVWDIKYGRINIYQLWTKSEVNIILTGPYITYWQSKKSLIFILHM